MFADMLAQIVAVAGDDYKAGIDARFIRVTPKVGFKFFWGWEKAQKTHRLQQIAYRHGIAPRILSDIYKFDTSPWGGSSKETMTGYFTESIHETLRERAARITRSTDYYEQDDYIYSFKDNSRSWKSFQKKSGKLPFRLADMHSSNIGFMTKTSKKPYVIDFSECDG